MRMLSKPINLIEMSATEKYNEHQDQIKKELETLKTKLNRHKNAQAKNSLNWSYIADLGNVLEKLKELNVFLD
jgi:hypothetical protein